MRHAPIAAVLLLGAALPAQQPADPAALAALQEVVQAAMRRVAPSVVRVETFGGTRRVLTADLAHTDGFSQPGRPAEPEALRYSDEDLRKLLEKIQPEELEEAFRRKGLPGKPDDEPLTPEDLRALGPDELRALFEKYELGPYEKRGLGPLVQPGFLQARGATTGVVLTADGWIAVSRFALNFDPTTILVTLPDGRSFNARRAGEDTSRGLALVKIEAEGLPIPEFAPPAEARVGQWAFALGRTFSPTGAPSIHLGIVSATGRLFGRALQIDAYTSPANYGGPVIDVRGRVLGIAVPLSPSGRDAGVDWYDSGIGFAATLADIPDLIERMQGGEVLERAWLGIEVDATHLGPGARVTKVVPDSPAEQLGLAPDAVITAVGDRPVHHGFHLQTLLGARLAGDTVTVTWRTGATEHTGTATLAAVPLRERESRTREEETFTLPWEGDGEGR